MDKLMSSIMTRRIFKDLSRGKLFRHPIHVMLVHFPSALIPTSFVFDFLGWIQADDAYSLVAFYTLIVAIFSGILAGIFGALDYSRLPPVHMAWKKASLHALLNTLWLIALISLFFIKFQTFPLITIATPEELMLLGFCVIGMIYSNYLGGELVFRHKLGTYENS